MFEKMAYQSTCLNQPWRRNVRDSINSLLSSLKWPTLQLRRESARVILFYKIINHILQILINYFSTPSPVITTRSRNDMKFLHYQPIINYFKYSFFPRTIPEWNRLSSGIVHADIFDSFKNLLYQYYNM